MPRIRDFDGPNYLPRIDVMDLCYFDRAAQKAVHKIYEAYAQDVDFESLLGGEIFSL